MLRALLLTLVVVALSAVEAQAGGCRCPSCGCHQMKKVCKPVCDVKKETKFVYDCVCEDFCVPGPSRIVGHCHKTDCRGCEHCCPVRQPTCAAVRTRTKLVKTAVEVEKPTIKWVVHTVCCGCGNICHNGCADGSCIQGAGPGGCANGVGCAEGCATGDAAAAFAPPPAPEAAPLQPLPPAPLKSAAYEPQQSALLEILTEERR